MKAIPSPLAPMDIKPEVKNVRMERIIQNGGETGAATCQSGDVIKYDNCKPCPNLGKYTTCPQGMTCEYEECSGLWYMTNCQNDHTYYCGFCPTY